jgi:hypothetical protein
VQCEKTIEDNKPANYHQARGKFPHGLFIASSRRSCGVSLDFYSSEAAKKYKAVNRIVKYIMRGIFAQQA